ncbi:hypothetical protein [Polynucleobacter sp. MWH-Aus1W21]|uniref:hypothetical protein n=1 Tax=Polynucleobacter sp. MWH-Aus1W21 TaxID=1855880 RepID=UPI001BFD2C10|nr:hypothetical protein [Polynucleobacter sp. MWH-Aus1W21]QWD66036.1 hypothetical protein ICW03_10380 [Polynucleobacter sp. MWH-Aus1W21]
MTIQGSQWVNSKGGMPETAKWLAGSAVAAALINPTLMSTVEKNWDAVDPISQTEVLWREATSFPKPSLDVSGFPAVRNFLNCYKQISPGSVQQIYDVLLGVFPEASISFESFKEVGALTALRFVVDLKGVNYQNLYDRELALFGKIESLPAGHLVLRNSIIDIN